MRNFTPCPVLLESLDKKRLCGWSVYSTLGELKIIA